MILECLGCQRNNEIPEKFAPNATQPKLSYCPRCAPNAWEVWKVAVNEGILKSKRVDIYWGVAKRFELPAAEYTGMLFGLEPPCQCNKCERFWRAA